MLPLEGASCLLPAADEGAGAGFAALALGATKNSLSGAVLGRGAAVLRSGVRLRCLLLYTGLRLRLASLGSSLFLRPSARCRLSEREELDLRGGDEGSSESEIRSARSLLCLARSWRSRTLWPPRLPRGLFALPAPLVLPFWLASRRAPEELALMCNSSSPGGAVVGAHAEGIQ